MNRGIGPPSPGDGDGRAPLPGHLTPHHHQHATKRTSTDHDTADHRHTASRAVNWFDGVYKWTQPWLEVCTSWPVIGTPAWSALPDDDPRKWAAVLDAAQRWALKLETEQTTMAEASKAIAASADWVAVARRHVQRHSVYIPRSAS